MAFLSLFEEDYLSIKFGDLTDLERDRAEQNMNLRFQKAKSEN